MGIICHFISEKPENYLRKNAFYLKTKTYNSVSMFFPNMFKITSYLLLSLRSLAAKKHGIHSSSQLSHESKRHFIRSSADSLSQYDHCFDGG